MLSPTRNNRSCGERILSILSKVFLFYTDLQKEKDYLFWRMPTLMQFTRVCGVVFFLYDSARLIFRWEPMDTKPSILALHALCILSNLPFVAQVVLGRRRVDRWAAKHSVVLFHLAWLALAMRLIRGIFCLESLELPRRIAHILMLGTLVLFAPIFPFWIRVLIAIIYFLFTFLFATVFNDVIPAEDYAGAAIWLVTMATCSWVTDFQDRQIFTLTIELRAEAKARQVAEEKAMVAVNTERRFFALMSHEIRTPLAGLLGFLDLLQLTNMTAVQSDYVKPMTSAAHALKTVIDDILDHSKLREGKFVLCPEVVNIGETVRSCLSLVQASLQQQGVALELSIDPRIPDQVLVDARRVQQILSNLLSNAVKFTESGKVAVSVSLQQNLEGGSESQKCIQVEVEDTGIGVADDHKARLFNAFSQADESIGRTYGGTGLGLSIVRGFASLMGGTADFRSTYGQGSCFWFNFPMIPAPSRSLHPESLNAVSLHGRYRVMVVDDTPLMLTLLRRVFHVIGFNGIFMESGAQAVSHIRNAAPSDLPDLVLMDIWMPEMTGFEAAEAILKIQPTIPIVALTADVGPEAEMNARKSGMRAVHQKPISKHSLIELCNQFCDSNEDSPMIGVNLEAWA